MCVCRATKLMSPPPPPSSSPFAFKAPSRPSAVQSGAMTTSHLSEGGRNEGVTYAFALPKALMLHKCLGNRGASLKK